MKKINIIILLISIVAFYSCNESEDLITAGAAEGGLMDVTSSSNSYVVGNPAGPYEIEFYINQLPK